MEWLASSLIYEHKVKLFALIDTLHLTHCVRPGILDETDIQKFDMKMEKLDSKLIFVKAEPQTIWERGILPRKNEEFILVYGKKFGSSLEEIHRYFVNEQIRLEQLALNSNMDKIFLEAENNFGENVEKAVNFWYG